MFPVHHNPAVRSIAGSLLGGHSRIHMLEPLGYIDFIGLLSQAWLIVSASDGVQDEAPTLGKPLLVLRQSTDRPEAIKSGFRGLSEMMPAGSSRCSNSPTGTRPGLNEWAS